MKQRRFRYWLALIGGLMLAGEIQAGAPKGVLANAQVTTLGDGHFRLQIQSSAPLAFDLTRPKNPALTYVRLYNARLGRLPALGKPGFGKYQFKSIAKDGDVQLTVTAKGCRVRAEQGESPNEVDLDIVR